MMENRKLLHIYRSMNATFLAQLWRETTHRFSLGHVPIQPSTKDREVDLFTEPAARIEMFINVPSVNGKDDAICYCNS